MGQTQQALGCLGTCAVSCPAILDDSQGKQSKNIPNPVPYFRRRCCREVEPGLLMSIEAFQMDGTLGRSANDGWVEESQLNSPGYRRSWRNYYTLGRLLGQGTYAKVYEASAIVPTCMEGEETTDSSPNLPRKVALKRFRVVGGKGYKREVQALRLVGVHPHILRFLETYEASDGEDVLVLEYCDGSDVYQLYASADRLDGLPNLPQKLVIRLVRQLLEAVEHLAQCGVFHHDIKPENLLLHELVTSRCEGQLKLGDFGWADHADGLGGLSGIPNNKGAGSLWYAAPELNPPVDNLPPEAMKEIDRNTPEKTDVWSVGVIAYLLLVGHSPFNQAMFKQNADERDNEVMRLAALGRVNRKTKHWAKLDNFTKKFLNMLLQVRASARPSAREALLHPLMCMACEGHGDIGKSLSIAIHNEQWARFDGLQQLAWVAVARAVADPELYMDMVASVTWSKNKESEFNKASYIYHLARELAMSTGRVVLEKQAAWREVVRLAFAYLDVDRDGMLSPHDLMQHFEVDFPAEPLPEDDSGDRTLTYSDSWTAVAGWLERWKTFRFKNSVQGLDFAGFCDVLMARQSDDIILHAPN